MEQNETPVMRTFPTIEELEQELERELKRCSLKKTITRICCTVTVTVAAILLIATLLLPVLQVYGSSMVPTLHEGNIVISAKNREYKRGDIIAFYCNDKVMIKRIIGIGGDWINIDPNGNVYVNGEMIDEPYLANKALGDCNIKFPCRVEEERVFVMGDSRDISVDSRSDRIGCIPEEFIIGKIIFKIWPF